MIRNLCTVIMEITAEIPKYNEVLLGELHAVRKRYEYKAPESQAPQGWNEVAGVLNHWCDPKMGGWQQKIADIFAGKE